MYGAVVIALLGLLLAFTFLMARAGPPPAVDLGDPHAADVAAFSAELADWDRRGRP